MCVHTGMVPLWSEDNLKEVVPPLLLLWAAGLELRSSGLHTSAFTHWTILPAQILFSLLSLETGLKL